VFHGLRVSSCVVLDLAIDSLECREDTFGGTRRELADHLLPTLCFGTHAPRDRCGRTSVVARRMGSAVPQDASDGRRRSVVRAPSAVFNVNADHFHSYLGVYTAISAAVLGCVVYGRMIWAYGTSRCDVLHEQ
jgi:hypothetical protein